MTPPTRAALVRFYAIALGWSALFGLLPALGPQIAPFVPPAAWFTIAGVPTMFGPLVAAWIAGRGLGLPFPEATGLRGRPNRWWLACWAVPVPFVLAVLLVGALLPGVSLSTPLEAVEAWADPSLPAEARAEAARALASVPPAIVAIGTVLSGLVAGATINAVAAFGEEAGWRGFLPRVLADAPFWRVALGTGALWGLWHAPLVLQGYNFPDAPVAGLGLMTVACALLTPPLLWLRGRAGSVLGAALFHGSLNGLAGLVFLFSAGGSATLVSPLGLAGCVVLLPVNLWLSRVVAADARVRDVVGDS